ncbi:hypothetical protein AB6D11_00775 [Vibrio splendidus]
MTKKHSYIDTGSKVLQIPHQTTAPLDAVPPAVYTLSSENEQLYLQRHLPQFELPKELFGNIQSDCDRLLFQYDESNEVSALLTGIKGAGKTLLSQLFSNAMIERKVPVILVNHLCAEPNTIKNFLYSLGNVCVIFDEYTKTFGEHQTQMLDFFSGPMCCKRATLVIENKVNDICEYMLDRPGRLMYHYSYKKLNLDTVKQVCMHFGLDEGVTAHVLTYSARVHSLGMDTLRTLVDQVIIESKRLDMSEQANFMALVQVLNIPYHDLNELEFTTLIMYGETYKNLKDFTVRLGGRRCRIILPENKSHSIYKQLNKKMPNWYKSQIDDDFIVLELEQHYQLAELDVFSTDTSDIEAEFSTKEKHQQIRTQR